MAVRIKERAAREGAAQMSPAGGAGRSAKGGSALRRPKSSVLRVDRSAEVEAPDQAGRDRLHEFLVVLDKPRIEGDAENIDGDRKVVRPVLGEPMLGLPGQVLAPRQPIFRRSEERRVGKECRSR